MQKTHATGLLMLLFMLLFVRVGAQTADSLLNRGDSLLAIKQMVKAELQQELQQSSAWKKVQQNTLAGLLKDSSALDTLGRLVLAQLQQRCNTGIQTGKSIITRTATGSKLLLQQQFAKTLQTPGVKALLHQFTGILHQPFLQWRGGIISIIGQTAPSLFTTGTVFINSNMLSSSWAVMGIPMALQFSRQDFTGPGYLSRTIVSFKFEREAYLQSLRDKIKPALKLAGLLPEYGDALQKIKADVLGRLTLSLDSVNTAFKGILGKQLAELGNLEDLLKNDIATLKDKLFSPGFLQAIEDQNKQLVLLQRQIDRGDKKAQVRYDSLLLCTQSVAGVNNIISCIGSFKEKMQTTGLLEKMQELAKSTGNMEPDKLKSLAKEQLNLTGIQKFFLNVQQLQAGMNTVSLSPLTLYQYTNNGINAAFVHNNAYLFVMAGSQREFAGAYDRRFAVPTFSTDNTAIGLRAGRGGLDGSHSHFSLFSYRQQKSSYGNHQVDVVPGKTIVATFSNQVNLNASGLLNLEISTSSHTYDKQKDISDTLLQGRGLSTQLPGSTNIIQQLAFTLQWNNETADRQLSYDIHATRIGRGYNNPGSLFLSPGMTEIGGSIKKNFLKSRLQLSARGNYREYAYSNGNNTWQNYHFTLQGKWKLKKGQWLALRYQPYQSYRKQDNKTAATGAASRLSFDMNIRRRFGKINYQQALTLAVLKNDYRLSIIPETNNSVLLSSIQTFSFNKESCYLSMQYNKASAVSVLAAFNTQYTVDAGIVYKLGKSLSANSAAIYNQTRDWYQQIGFRQGLSGQWGDRITISCFADISKIIKQYRQVNTDNIRVDWSFQYSLK